MLSMAHYSTANKISDDQLRQRLHEAMSDGSDSEGVASFAAWLSANPGAPL